MSIPAIGRMPLWGGSPFMRAGRAAQGGCDPCVHRQRLGAAHGVTLPTGVETPANLGGVGTTGDSGVVSATAAASAASGIDQPDPAPSAVAGGDDAMALAVDAAAAAAGQSGGAPAADPAVTASAGVDGTPGVGGATVVNFSFYLRLSTQVIGMGQPGLAESMHQTFRSVADVLGQQASDQQLADDPIGRLLRGFERRLADGAEQGAGYLGDLARLSRSGVASLANLLQQFGASGTAPATTGSGTGGFQMVSAPGFDLGTVARTMDLGGMSAPVRPPVRNAMGQPLTIVGGPVRNLSNTAAGYGPSMAQAPAGRAATAGATGGNGISIVNGAAAGENTAPAAETGGSESDVAAATGAAGNDGVDWRSPTGGWRSAWSAPVRVLDAVVALGSVQYSTDQGPAASTAVNGMESGNPRRGFVPPGAYRGFIRDFLRLVSSLLEDLAASGNHPENAGGATTSTPASSAAAASGSNAAGDEATTSPADDGRSGVPTQVVLRRDPLPAIDVPDTVG